MIGEAAPLDQPHAEVPVPLVLADLVDGHDIGKVEARHDFQVRAALRSGPCSLLILGGGHDLSAAVRRLGGGDTEYLRVFTRRYEQFAGEGDRR